MAEPLFLETSALLRLVFDEDGGVTVEEKLRQAPRILASRLLRVESERALLRAAVDRADGAAIAEAQRELQGLWPIVDFLEMTREICDLAGRVAPSTRLRSLDALHLATFLYAREREPKLSFLSFDQRLLGAL